MSMIQAKEGVLYAAAEEFGNIMDESEYHQGCTRLSRDDEAD